MTTDHPLYGLLDNGLPLTTLVKPHAQGGWYWSVNYTNRGGVWEDYRVNDDGVTWTRYGAEYRVRRAVRRVAKRRARLGWIGEQP